MMIIGGEDTRTLVTPHPVYRRQLFDPLIEVRVKAESDRDPRTVRSSSAGNGRSAVTASASRRRAPL